jgi:hypothetical protein
MAYHLFDPTILATALRRAELLRSDGPHAASTGQRGYQAGARCIVERVRECFSSPGLGSALAFAFSERRRSEAVRLGWIGSGISRVWRASPSAQVTDLAMAGIQIDRTKTESSMRRGRALLLVAARRRLCGSLERADITKEPVFRRGDEPDR